MIRTTFNRIAVLLLLSLPCFGQHRTNQTVSHEEQVVRAAYARLSCAAQIGYAWHQSNEDPSQTNASSGSVGDDRSKEGLNFELTDFAVGQLSSLSSMPWTSLVSGPVKVLNAEYRSLRPSSSNTGPPKSGAHLSYADVMWDSSAHEAVSDLVMPDHPVTVMEYIDSLQQPKSEEGWTRYASYFVVATQGEHKISYRATFLFSGSGEREEILPLDYATAMTIAPFVTTRLNPAQLAETVFSSKPLLRSDVVRNEGCRWLIRHEENSATLKTSPKETPATTLPCIIEACKQTSGRLPASCPAGDLKFSVDAGNIVNTNSNSRPEFTCTWICVDSKRPELQERHGPWALLLIDGAPIHFPQRD